MEFDLEKLSLLKHHSDIYSLESLFIEENEQMYEDGLPKNDYVIEYEKIRNEIIESISIEIQSELKTKVEDIFKRSSLLDYNLDMIEQKLSSICYNFYKNRNDYKIKRDQLLDINILNYSNQYTELDEYITIYKLDQERKKENNKIKELLTNQYIEKFNELLLSDEIPIISSIYNYRSNLEIQFKNDFENRDSITVQRDRYAFITIKDYEETIFHSFIKTIEMAQISEQNYITSKLREFLTKKINLQNTPHYYYELDVELKDYTDYLYGTRFENNQIIIKNNLMNKSIYGYLRDEIALEFKEMYYNNNDLEYDDFPF